MDNTITTSIMQKEIVSETKFCPKCNQDVLKSNFSKNINSTDNLQTYCKTCAYKIRSSDAEKRRNERLQSGVIEGEEWKTIEGYSKYEFSNQGRIRNLFSKEILQGMKTECGFYRTTLTNDAGKKKQKGIHEIIATAFIPNPENKKM